MKATLTVSGDSHGVPIPLPHDHAITATCSISTKVMVDRCEKIFFIDTDPTSTEMNMTCESSSEEACLMSVSLDVTPKHELNPWLQDLPKQALYCEVQVACHH